MNLMFANFEFEVNETFGYDGRGRKNNIRRQ